MTNGIETRGVDRDFAIVDVRATTVSVPLEAPLRHAVGAHWCSFPDHDG